MSDEKRDGQLEEPAKSAGGGDKAADGGKAPAKAEKEAERAINPSSPGDTGTTPGTNAANG